MIKKIKEKIQAVWKSVKDFIKNTAEDLYIIDIEEGKARWSINWWLLKAVKWITAIILAVAALFLWGCSGGVVTKYYPVNMPVSCKINMPDKPEYNDNIVTTNLNIISYSSKLEAALKACRGENAW